MNAIATLLGFGQKKPAVVAPAPKRKVAAKQAAQPAAEQHKWARSFAEIPTYRCIHTGKKSDLAKGVTDEFRRGCIVLGNEKAASFYVEPRFHEDREVVGTLHGGAAQKPLAYGSTTTTTPLQS
ncbi:hypothetical protein ACTMU2_13835 [Cupriavidus basilensis]